MTEANSKVIAPAMQSKNPRIKWTVELFISKAKEVHGDNYDYSRSTFVKINEPVDIRCNKCERYFKQRPYSHLSGHGCNFCARRKSTGDFVKKAILVHGQKYDYSMVEYETNKSRVSITCKICNHRFVQSAASHLAGHGCPECSTKYKKKSKKQFIADAMGVHGDRYDYSLVVYESNKDIIDIVCKKHNSIFQQQALSHLRGSGCPACGGVKRYNTDTFKLAAIEIHGKKYDYSEVVYKNNKTPVRIVCPKHGVFELRPFDHIIDRNGCGKCGGHGQSTEEAVKQLQEVHGKYRYDYSLVVHTTWGSKIKIKCNSCNGVFEQVAAQHKTGRGCPDCASASGYRRDAYVKNANLRHHGRSSLYVIECFDGDEESFFKIGITVHDIKVRFRKGVAMPYNFKPIKRIWQGAEFIWDLEKQLHRLLKRYKYQPKISFGGETECFSHIPKEVIKFLDDLEKTDQLQLIA